jgi:hypothetical protein
MRREALVILTVLMALLCARPAGAESGYRSQVELLPPPDGIAWNLLTGEYRFAMHHVGGFALDENGTPGPISNWAEHRVRLSPTVAWRFIGLKFDVDLIDGQVMGDHEDLYPDYRRLDRRRENSGLGTDSLLLRNGYVQVATPVGLIRAGRMTSQYGLGVIANAGEDDDDRFGVRRFGDVVDRGLLLLKPFRPLTGQDAWGDYLTFMGSADLVFRDENAVFADEDRAYQGNGGIFWMHPRYTNGAVFTRRVQEDADGDELEAYVVNVNGRNRLALSTMPSDEPGKGEVDDLALSLAYELVWLMGHTDRLQQLGSPEGLDLESFGAVGRLGFEWNSIGLEADLEVGYASGDNNNYDDESHAFFFDPDYNVGMVFFDEMLPLITARAAEISSDPANLAVPPKGLDLVPSQGRVTNALYYFPQLRYTWHPDSEFVEKLQGLMGGLVITTPAYFGHSYYTFRNGGLAANHLGRSTDSRYVGTELLAGLRFEVWPWPDHVGLSLKLDQSYFLPGAALADPDGKTPDPVWKVVGTAALHWR